MKFISDETKEALQQWIEEFLDHYRPSEYGSDFRCEFCNRSPKPRADGIGSDAIEHSVNCKGVQMLDALLNSDDLLYATIGVNSTEKDTKRG